MSSSLSVAQPRSQFRTSLWALRLTKVVRPTPPRSSPSSLFQYQSSDSTLTPVSRCWHSLSLWPQASPDDVLTCARLREYRTYRHQSNDAYSRQQRTRPNVRRILVLDATVTMPPLVGIVSSSVESRLFFRRFLVAKATTDCDSSAVGEQPLEPLAGVMNTLFLFSYYAALEIGPVCVVYPIIHSCYRLCSNLTPTAGSTRSVRISPLFTHSNTPVTIAGYMQ